MNDDVIFERNAQAWLEGGPAVAPDRVVQAALHIIETTPQQRVLRIPWRFPSMKLSPRLATAAVVAIVVIAAGFLLVRNNQSQIAAPATATPLVSPEPTPQSIHDLLSTKWVATGDRIADLKASGGFLPGGWITFNDTGLKIDTYKGSTVNPWSIQADGTLFTKLRDTQALLDPARYWDCSPGDAGTYRVAFSAFNNLLTLTPTHDACATRVRILNGGWTRWPCTNLDSACGTELSPGAHVTSFLPNIDPNLLGSPPPTALGWFSYTVPAGWSEIGGRGLGRPNDPWTMGIQLTLDVAPHSQAADCPDAAHPTGWTAASDVAAFLVGVPGLVTTAPQPVTIGGFSGLMFDASVAPTWKQTCSQLYDGPKRVIFTFADPEPGPHGWVFIRDFIEEDAHARIILLDISTGHNLLIEVTAPDEASFNELTQAAMPIINSMAFSQ